MSSAAPSWHISVDTAVSIAERSANASELPQTVYRTQDTGGWTNTNALASSLGKRETELAVTILPKRYFA